ncbi:MAG: RES family NAD+ phosphorylase [Gammaproteobacteria bacterium]|nr:RES family NAD+ phosphorylase [Gammaproteobacteria bacterium]
MSDDRYPRSLIERLLVRTAFPDSYRIIPRRHVGSPLGATPADSRFATRTGSYTVLYSAPAFTTAFIETIVRDRFVHRRTRKVAFREITERVWVRISAESSTGLTFLDLRADGCTRIGAPTDVVQARNHAAGRAFGKAIHASHEDVDGLVYSSRLTGEDVYAIYERSVRKLNVGEVGQLEEHVELPDVLERHGIGLLV